MPTMEMIGVLAASGLLLAGFGANEVTHGGVSEAMGLDHNHMLDYGDYHCADPGDTEHWDEHVEHVHGGQNTTDDHDHCGAGHMGTGDHMSDRETTR